MFKRPEGQLKHCGRHRILGSIFFLQKNQTPVFFATAAKIKDFARKIGWGRGVVAGEHIL